MIHEAESRIVGCEECRRDEAHVPFDWVLADVDRKGAVEFAMTAEAHCPNCKAMIDEKTPVEPDGGLEITNPEPIPPEVN